MTPPACRHVSSRPPRRAHAAALLLSLFALLPLSTTAGAEAGERSYRYVDAHLHYVDFFQRSDGVDALFEAMDEGDIDSAVLMGIPVAKKWHEDEPKRPRYYQGDDAPLYWYSATDALVAEAVRDLPRRQRERLHPFLSGFNPNDKNAVTHIEQMIRLYPDVWVGIGEVMTRHDDLTALIQGEAPRANNEAMMRVYRLAAAHDLPVLLHSNVTSVREREPLYLEELEEALSANPDTRFIWAHAGTSAAIHRNQERLDFLLKTVSELLDTHDNLCIDLSWSVLDPYLLDDDGEPDPEWLALIERHPQRFVLGSDLVGRFGRICAKLDAFRPVLDALPEAVAEGVAGGNLRRVLPASGARIEDTSDD